LLKNTKQPPKPNTVRTCRYNCSYVTVMTVLIIFPVILQTVVNFRIMSIGGQGVKMAT